MEIVSLFGAVKNYDKGLLKITSLVNNTLAELGMGVKDLNIGPPTNLPYYDGIKSQVAAEFINSIKEATGLIIATTAGTGGMSSVLATFLEHLESEPDILKDKNCMLIVVSDTSDVSVMSGLSKTVNALGGYDSVRIFLDGNFFGMPNNKEIVEKQVEDFYRMVRQKRKFYTPTLQGAVVKGSSNSAVTTSSEPQAFVPPKLHPEPPAPMPAPVTYDGNIGSPQYTGQADTFFTGSMASAPSYQPPSQPQPQPPVQKSSNPYVEQVFSNLNQITQGGAATAQALTLQPQPQPQQVKPTVFQPEPVAAYTPPQAPPPLMSNPTTQYNTNTITSMVDNFNQRQNDDIQEITSFFSKKHVNNEPGYTPPSTYQAKDAPATFPTNIAQKSTRQLTASLIHHYQPQLAGDLSCIIQLLIEGPTGFNGYIIVNSIDCFYYDGEADNPTLTVISDEQNWTNVITGKVSAQKAFMTGSLKIKGNFVLLTRFDQIFNTAKNF